MKLEEALKEISFYGRKCSELGLVVASGGNISIRSGKRIYITKHGCSLGKIERGDIVCVFLNKRSKRDKKASMDLEIHRAIYRASNFKAVLHTHPPFIIALSIHLDTYKPIDFESRLYLGSVPIIRSKHLSQEFLNDISRVFKEGGAVIARGHGIYVAGGSLEEAFNITNLIEHSAKIAYLTSSLRKVA